MSPSLRNGSFYLLDQSAGKKEIHSGDVVVFRCGGVNYIKRVVAVGGDQVYVTTTPSSGSDELVMDWQLNRMRRFFAQPERRFCVKMVARKVPPGTCYVVGDHITDSVDSRELGPIPVELIIGKLVDAPEPTPYLDHLAVIAGEDPQIQKS
jgi:signal peptidase I